MMLPPHPKSKLRSEAITLSSCKAVWPLTIRAAGTVIPLILIVLIGFAGCGGLSNPKPSDEEIRKAIMARGAWNPLVGRIEVESVQIEQIGNFNAEKRYWPVKARVTTKYQNAVLEYQIFRDDFGKWSARQADRS